ncbi:hypothetical protein J2790_002973 [Paenarthrobacter nicotinovorans]|uniref:peptidase inhibitor family I36 protein n=1 Tax=Micrococcaceae TaxID=1268 RepID=UPI0008764ECD|nr:MULTISPECIES: peptidase inhibitor family I36 protein [Micrococcaceae]MDR6437824.1 hypothetical protein [Paenarthrobacter nicotinovorans]SCZ64797.1 hypothetical protein SAMN02799638_03987 [Arthrobacter sp. UNCCL28]
MKIIKRMTGTVSLLGLAAGAFLAGAPAAQAGSTCPYERLRLYFNSNYEGARADTQYSDGWLGDELFNNGPAGANGWNVQVNNNAASIINNTSETVWVYDDSHCGGNPLSIGPGGRWNLEALGLKNKVSSFFIDNRGNCANR